MARYYLYSCIGSRCDDELLVFSDIYELLIFIHGLFRFNEKVNRIVIEKVVE